ncbi:MAG TPA: S-layer homology domain-containing protein [Chloroflexia bacterium]|nr:S-layer homology domain-containing protein [Chloroflexia bacterium]
MWGTWLRPALGLAVIAALAALTRWPAAGAGRVATPPLGGTGDWPMYGHDAARTNYNPAETTLNPGNVSSLVPRWQRSLGTAGSPSASGPVISNGRVYVGSSVMAGPNFFAFEATTGAPAWSADLGHMPSCFNVGIGSTAAVSGTLLAVGGGDGAYYGRDALTGGALWRVPLNVGPSGFAWESPLLANGRAYLGIASDCDNPSVRGEIRAVDATSGALLANQYFVPPGQAGGGIWNSPALSPDGSTLAVVSGEDFGGYSGPYNRAMMVLDPLSLAVRAAHQTGLPDLDQDYASTPVIFQNRNGRVMVAANHKDGTFYAFTLNDLTAGPVWARPMSFMAGMMPAYDPTFGTGGTLFLVDANGGMFAADTANGARRWGVVTAGILHGNLAVANGLIFANTGAGGLVVLDEHTGTVLRTLLPEHPGDTYSGVAVAGGFVYWVAGEYLNAWSLPAPAATATPVPPTATPEAGCIFADVCPSAYFFRAVQDLVERNAISGYADGTFRPYAGATRGQLVKIVTAAFGIPPYAPVTPTFEDVPASAPFYPYVEAAVHASLVSGYADGTFRADNPVTRAQLTKLTAGAAGWLLLAPDAASFADVPPSDPFYPFVATAVCHGIISGYSCGGPGEPCDTENRPYFRPGAPATRGQIAKIVDLALTRPGTCAAGRPLP